MKYRIVVTVEQRESDFAGWQEAGFRVPLGPEVGDFARLQRTLMVVKSVEDLAPSLGNLL